MQLSVVSDQQSCCVVTCVTESRQLKVSDLLLALRNYEGYSAAPATRTAAEWGLHNAQAWAKKPQLLELPCSDRADRTWEGPLGWGWISCGVLGGAIEERQGARGVKLSVFYVPPKRGLVGWNWKNRRVKSRIDSFESWSHRHILVVMN
ncbi:hypothetical protein LIA77_06696 [Sarocladium implicatum]|nr:hypothetical protein LIA77_06696 [Sarocladium implicatum]